MSALSDIINMKLLKEYFLLNPKIIFLNHGSFGACPKPVFETYQNWQRELEEQPVKFLGRHIAGLMAEARENLANYVNCAPEDIVYFPNPSTAINMVVRNLNLKPGDEVLTSDHEYGAMDRTWRVICEKSGAKYIQQSIPTPVTDQDDFVDRFWGGVTDQTRFIFISHITSPTALIFPVKEICRRARDANILTIVDGAHVPGQTPIDLRELGADIYTGACHKWMMAPKGSSFLYASRNVQQMLDPLVISWGFDPEPGYSSGYPYIDYHEWQGTRDMAAFLSVPAAINFQRQHDWERVRQDCHRLAKETRQRINDLTGMASICPDSGDWYLQMTTIRLPQLDVKSLKERLYQEFKIEVPIIRWQGQVFMRVSFQGYNSRTDADALVSALEKILPT